MTASESNTSKSVPPVYYKHCVCCGKSDQPFEQRGWVQCIECSIEGVIFDLEHNHENMKPKQLQKTLKHFESFEPFVRAIQLWDEISLIIDYGYVTPEFRGKAALHNFVSMTLTDKGKKVLGRT